MYDAIVILGGSYIDEKTLPKWVENRLDAAILHKSHTASFIVASRGTVHKPPVLDSDRYPIDECTIMANYLLEHGIPNDKIYKESWSLDTIGNAYGIFTHHAIPRNLRKFLIITSDFHMPRSKAIFKHVFSLFPIEIFHLDFLETNSCLSISEKEHASLIHWRENANNIHTLADLHEFIFVKHDAYNVKKNHKRYDLTNNNAHMYCL